MGCIFFEGFNHENTDYTKLDQTYWSGDYSPAFIKGRTDNAHIIPSRSSEDPNLTNNETLWLSGFPAITGSGSYYGAGFFISEISTNTSGNGSSFPYRENIVSFYDDQTEIFKLNTIWMLESGIAIELEQNNSYTGIPLYHNPLLFDEFSTTELLVHFDGGTNAEHLADYSENDLTVSLETASSASSFITSPGKFGDNAHNFNDNVSNGISVQLNKSLFDSDFTVEYWVKRGENNAFFQIAGYSSTTSQYSRLLYNFINVSDYGDQYITETPSLSTTDTEGENIFTDTTNYHHLAIVRTGDIIKHYIDGSLIQVDGTTTYRDVSTDSDFISTGSDNGYVQVNIGYDYLGDIAPAWSESSDMVIDELRISSTGLYTADFSSNLPTSAFPNSASAANNPNHFIDSRTYTITTENDRQVLRLYTPSSDISIAENTISDICGADKPEIVTSSAIYLEVYGQANDGASPATTGNLHIKVDGLEITPSTGVAISGFNNLNRIQLHGTHYPSGECDEDTYSLSYSQYNSLQNENRIIDDLYIASGTGINEVNLGASVRIFKCVPNANSRYEWRRNQDYPIQTILSSNDNQTWAGSNVDGSMVVNQYSNISTTNDIVDGIKIRNLNQSDYEQKNYCNIMISGSNASTGPFLTLGSPKSVDSRHFTDNNEFVFQNPATQTNWTKTDINNLQAGAMVGTITSDCEANGGYVIQDSGDEQANGVYCQNLSQGASINILSTSDTYYNTKNNGYYIAYEDSTEQDSGWYLYDPSANKLYKNNAAQNSIAPITSWSLSDYGLYPPPSVTLSLNRGYYDETSQQNIHYMP